MKCLMRYEWVKLSRALLPCGRGVMGAWAKLASKAAFRKGTASYCGHINAVSPGMWSGGIVGVKSILGVRSRAAAFDTLKSLAELGCLKYEFDEKTKKLTYEISDWVVKCSGAECLVGSVYATDGYGFLCLPRSITERLIQKNYKFEEADAWLDLWCHTVYEDSDNAGSERQTLQKHENSPVKTYVKTLIFRRFKNTVLLKNEKHRKFRAFLFAQKRDFRQREQSGWRNLLMNGGDSLWYNSARAVMFGSL